jgi:hypothetical protein
MAGVLPLSPAFACKRQLPVDGCSRDSDGRCLSLLRSPDFFPEQIRIASKLVVSVVHR